MFDWDTHVSLTEMELNTMYYTSNQWIKEKIIDYVFSDTNSGEIIFEDERGDSSGWYKLYIYSYGNEYIIITSEFEKDGDTEYFDGATMQLQRINWEPTNDHVIASLKLELLIRGCNYVINSPEEFHNIKQVWRTNYDELFDNFMSAEWYDYVYKKEFSISLPKNETSELPHNPSDCTLTWLKLDTNTYRDYYYCESYPKCKIIQYQELTPSDDTYTDNISDSDYEEMYKDLEQREELYKDKFIGVDN